MSAARWMFGAVCAAAAGGWSLPTQAVDITPHRAIYTMSLERAQSSSGVVDAGGTMLFEWADSCQGWTIEQRYKLRMQYSESAETELSISFVTWEAKDGLRYRFNVRKLRDGDPDEDLRGEARVPGAGAADNAKGEANFVRPETLTLDLPPTTQFPSNHTMTLIKAAIEGESFVSRFVFDGGTVEGPFEVTAGIGKLHPADESAAEPLLRQRWWPMRLAFFPTDSQSPQPDYELGMDMQDNGIARQMVLDYGNFVIRAKLDKVEALPKPHC